MTLTVRRPVRLYVYVLMDELGQLKGVHGSMDSAIDQFYALVNERCVMTPPWERCRTQGAEPETELTLEGQRHMLSTFVKFPGDVGGCFHQGRIRIIRTRVTPPKPNEERTTFLPKPASEFVMEVTEVTRA